MTDSTERSCVVCDRLFSVPRRRGGVQKTCSVECRGIRRSRANYATDRGCLGCGSKFKAKSTQKFCSKRCQFDAQVTHGRNRRDRKPYRSMKAVVDEFDSGEFFRRIKKRVAVAESGCWEWQGYIDEG